MADTDSHGGVRHLGSNSSEKLGSWDYPRAARARLGMAAEARALREASVIFAAAGEDRDTLSEQVACRVALSLGMHVFCACLIVRCSDLSRCIKWILQVAAS
jgi:hypothetical protein